MTTIGAHLLGRKPNRPDPRDFRLAWFLDNPDPLEAALAALTASPQAAKATKLWAAVATTRILAVSPAPQPAPAPPAPTPTPGPDPAPPTTAAVLWADARQLDQGDTGHCVGFGWAQFGNSDPVDDSYANADGDAIYYECKVIDGEPGQEDGSEVRSGAKAMVNRGRIKAYAFASTMDEIVAWIRQHGPVVVGTDWHEAMFNPDTDGTIHVDGDVAGGHCYVLDGVNADGTILNGQNSWGESWGIDGRFKISVPDFATLLAAQGDACATVELPL